MSVVVREPHYKRLASTDRDGTLGRLRKNDCQELEARLVYRVGLFSFFFKKTKTDTHNRCPQFSLALRVTPRFGSGTKSENAGVRRPVLYDVMQAGAGPADAGLGTWPRQSPGGGSWVWSRAEWNS